MDILNELLYLLSGHDLNANDVSSIAIAIRNSVEDAELDWMDKDCGQPVDVARRQMVELENQLSDWFAVSDKIDELHEQIEDWFDPPLASFPHEKGLNTADYFRWLDSILSNRPGGSYVLLNFESGWGDDNLHVILAHHADLSRILGLCEKMQFPVHPATSMFDR